MKNWPWRLTFVFLVSLLATSCAPAEQESVVRKEPPRWPSLQNPWDCLAGTSVTISGTIIELSRTGFVMDTRYRLVNVDLTGWRELSSEELKIGDDVRVQGSVQHGSFAQPELDAQLISVNRLGRTLGNGTRSSSADTLLVQGTSNC